MLRATFVFQTALLLGLAYAWLAPLPAAARGVSALAARQADDTFLAARDAALLGNRERFEALAGGLKDHPLAAYIELWRLTLRLRTDAPERIDADVAGFIARHAGTYVADRMRLEWLLALGGRRDYAAFERELPLLVWHDDPQLRCYAALARYQRNEGRRIDELAAEARRLLAAMRDGGSDGCWALTEALAIDERISPWERMRVLVENNQPAVAKRLVAWLPKANSAAIAQAIDRPAAWLAANERALTAQRELALVAIARLARDDPQRAAHYAERLEPHLAPEARARTWGRIAHMAAYKLMPEALAWYRRGGELVGVAPETARADEVLEWQVRAALRGDASGPDWALVRATVERMPLPLRRDPAWIYWHARALLAADRADQAHVYLRLIADRLDFYGRLAAEELGLPFTLARPAQPPTEQEVAALDGNPGFARALKFYELGLRMEGNREWSWQLRGKSDRELLAAAEYARRRSVFDRMIAASERTRAEIDLDSRYPAPHRDELMQHAEAAGLDPAWVYGLIRQESRFIADARSSAGAQGLMQLMPATAQYVARRVRMNDFRPGRVTEPEVNLRLGTQYLRLVYDDLDANALLASAAYNAGPMRARAWRAALPRAVEGAIFAETIPFNETRDYVKKVLANSVIYAALFGNGESSLKARLGSIAPRAAGTTDLP
ncbi:MAG TPA: transglycosylase SLT domain-containing protein [Burkholderiaceae bacterium]|jgi:soluble lytic murein transglycosylase|nr:transglycosylase SLT domain-containing protein [Burkholderiaceae bacterium]